MKTPSQALAARIVRLLLLGLVLAGSLFAGGAGAALKEGNWDGDPVTRFRASLSHAELHWLDAHPELRVGNGPDFQPFYAWRDKRYTGPSADYLELLSRRTGLRFKFVRFDDFPTTTQALERGRIDLIPTLSPTDARRRKFLFTGGYLHSPPIVVTRSGRGAIALPGNLEGIRIAIERGHASREVLTRSRPKAQILETATTEDALRAVSNGNADAYVGMLAVAHFYIEQLGLANLQVRQRFDADLSAMAFAVNNAEPTLLAILQKAMRFISEEEGKALVRRYLPPGEGIPGVSFQLTAAEQAWLLGHGPIRMGYDQAFYPLSYTNRHHQAEGYSIELFRLLRDKAGLTVEETAGPWSAVLQKTFGGKLDVLVAVANTPERREHLHFIGPYLSSPTAIVTRSNFQQVWDLASFTGRKLALLKDHFLINRIRSAYPSIELVEVGAQEEALSLVAAGAADVAIGNLHAVNRLIQSRFLGTLYIAGHVPDGDSELYLGVAKDAPELAAILRRALESVTPTDIATAKNRWLDTIYNPGQPSPPHARPPAPLPLDRPGPQRGLPAAGHRPGRRTPRPPRHRRPADRPRPRAGPDQPEPPPRQRRPQASPRRRRPGPRHRTRRPDPDHPAGPRRQPPARRKRQTAGKRLTGIRRRPGGPPLTARAPGRCCRRSAGPTPSRAGTTAPAAPPNRG